MKIAGVHKETVQTRWIVATVAAAAVLIPIMQRVMEAIMAARVIGAQMSRGEISN